MLTPGRDKVREGHTVITTSVWRTLARLVVSLGLVLALGAWAAMATALMILQCDENCAVPGPQADAWQYTVQGLVALTGATMGVLALCLGFTRHRSAYVWCAGGTVLVFLAWWYLVQTWTL